MSNLIQSIFILGISLVFGANIAGVVLDKTEAKYQQMDAVLQSVDYDSLSKEAEGLLDGMPEMLDSITITVGK